MKKCAVVGLLVSDLIALGLSVVSSPINEVPGHAVVPELSYAAWETELARLLTIIDRLAELASTCIVHKPAT